MIETQEQQDKRWSDLQALQAHYTDFRDFYWDVSVDLIGAEPTEEQLDIAKFVAYGPQYAMVQAQRGEAKTTITGAYGVYSLIHKPFSRVLVVTAGENLSKQISTWMIQILNNMPELECMLCDPTHPGARRSVVAYDIHHTLKGPGKDPSIGCFGITSTSQGFRSDLLIADDVESKKNSKTAHMREQLRELTRDFSSLNEKGRIIYLGTPQSTSSIYNDLPGRGYTVRIWPGRFPTVEEEENYGDHLAPWIKEKMERHPELRTGGGPLGERGQPTDPIMKSEEELTFKEIDQTKAYFDLQHMLDTTLSDADRYPLKLSDLIFYSFDLEDAPAKFTWSNDPAFIMPHPQGTAVQDHIYRPAKISDDFFPYTYKLMSIDPAGGGQNGDETGVSVLYANSSGWIAAMDITGIPGGTHPRKLKQIVQLAVKWDVHDCIVERNYGGDAWPNALTAAFADAEHPMSIDTVWASGQKELRIIDALEPVMGFHKLILNASIPQSDVLAMQKYATEHQKLYSLLFQIKYITRDRGALIHDDRLESLSQGVAHLMKVIKQDHPDKPKPPTDYFKGFKKDPASGIWRFADRVSTTTPSNSIGVSLMDKFK